MYIVKVIPSTKLSAQKVNGLVLKTMQEVEKRVLEDFHKTTESWVHQPNFEHHFTFAGGNAVIEVHTNDKPWNWLNAGTNVRYLQLPRNFKRKTAPGVLGSWPGTHLNPKDKHINTNRPHDGITARKWSQMISDKYDDVLQAALDDALRNWWYGTARRW